MFVPRARFAHTEFWNENVHLGVELDQDPVRVVVIARQIVTCRMASRPPFRFDARPTELVAGRGVRGAVLQLKGDVMNIVDSGMSTMLMTW